MDERGGVHTHSGRKWAIGVFLGVFIVLVGWAAFGPDRKPDLAKVDPRITELREPMKIDFTFHPNEPQSCVFWIEDHTGKTLLISIHKLYADPEVYLSSIRNPDCMKPNAYPQDDLLFIQNLLRTHSPMDERAELASRYLSVSPLDKGLEQAIQRAKELDDFFRTP